MKNIIILFVLCIFSGCTASTYSLIGGDRSAGSVTLACTFDLGLKCEENPQEMKQLAAEACRKWGYQSAEAFGGERVFTTGGYGGYLEKQYQCIGDLEL